MKAVQLKSLELTEFIAKDNPGQRCKATFPMFGAHGTKDCATVYFELAPGERLGRHTDSAEELLLILEGTVEASIGEESGILPEGSLALVPEMTPHDLRNVGDKTVKVLGFFGRNHIVATFDNVWWPTESNSVDTSKM
jgi:quercetin dioxygenase-like cupin family protein